MAKTETFSAEEKAAMAEAVKERKAQAKRGGRDDRAEGEAEVQAKIGEMPEPDRTMAKRLHDLITATAPDVVPRTWYGMPAYALDGNVICFFQPASKFKARYGTLGFSDKAKLDDGDMWPTTFAITRLTGTEESRIAALVRKAIG